MFLKLAILLSGTFSVTCVLNTLTLELKTRWSFAKEPLNLMIFYGKMLTSLDTKSLETKYYLTSSVLPFLFLVAIFSMYCKFKKEI